MGEFGGVRMYGTYLIYKKLDLDLDLRGQNCMYVAVSRRER